MIVVQDFPFNISGAICQWNTNNEGSDAKQKSGEIFKDVPN
jgi:hypothetical protein